MTTKKSLLHNACILLFAIAFCQLRDLHISAYSLSNPNTKASKKMFELSYSDASVFPTATIAAPVTIRPRNTPVTGTTKGSNKTYRIHRKKLPSSILKPCLSLHPETVARTPPPAVHGPKTLSTTTHENPFRQLLRAVPTEKLSLSYLRQKAERIGIYPFLVYNIISQINSGTTMSLASYLFSCRTGLSPFNPAQWKVFLAFYAPFLVANNVLRPFRLAAAVALTKNFERAVDFTQNRFSLNQKSHAIAATTVVVYGGAVCYSASCFLAASLFSGVPVFGSGVAL